MTIFYNQPSNFEFPIDSSLRKLHQENTLMQHLRHPNLASISRLNLAGYKKEELDISIHDHKITVKASHPAEENKDNKFNYLINESRSSPAASRTWKIPEHVTQDNIHAAYTDGLLTLRYSRHAPESEPKKININ
ncbi:hypothetical protein E3Q15_02242 [Wallemia mellicola]|nr:hypothetical protein E3Q15_02242 [Wallemia mellicola]TIC56731.1 hypothetical protein E3Q05_01618 [Wallemia mellicola]